MTALRTIRKALTKLPFLRVFLSRVRRRLGACVATGLDNRFHIAEARWRRRGIEEARAYWDSESNRVRARYLAEALVPHAPHSVLEVGCNCGNILLQLSMIMPGVAFTGIDLNQYAIAKGREWLDAAGATGITLVEASAEQIAYRVPGPFDVVFSLASLIYIPPASIASVLSGMIRVSRRAVILMEMQHDEPAPDGRAFGEYCPVSGLCQGNWKRDYPEIIRGLGIPVRGVSVRKVPSEVWLPGGGGAALIEITK